METQASSLLSILALIPARGGSKGVPGKNIKLLGGIPLVARTINTAREAGCCDRLWVSTDDAAIADIAVQYGVRVPWLRPPELATDNARMVDVLSHLLVRLQEEEGYRPDAVMVLQPTSPFRTVQTIRKSVALFQRSGGRTIVSVTQARHHPHWCYQINPERGFLQPFVEGSGPPLPRQDLPDAYVLDGSIHLISVGQFLNNRSFFSGEDCPLIVSPDEAIDIDTQFDWLIAESVYNMRRNQEG